MSLFVEVMKQTAPIAWWRLNELSGLVAVDLIGSRSGIYSAAGITHGIVGPVLGEPSTATFFDGIAGTVDVPYDAVLNPALWSVGSIWKESVGQGSNDPLIDCRPASSGALAAGFDLFLNVGTGVGISVCSTNVAQTIITWEPATLLSKWHWSIATYDGTQVRLYGDGVLRTGPTTCPFTPNPNKPIGMGHLTGGGNFAQVNIAENAIWNRALTATEIAYLWWAMAAKFKSNAHFITSRDGIGVIGTR